MAWLVPMLLFGTGAAAELAVSIEVLAYAGQPVPGGAAGASFVSLDGSRLSAAGDVMISATATLDGAQAVSGVWTWRPGEGLRPVVQEGDAVLEDGSGGPSLVSFLRPVGSGFNEAGEVVFLANEIRSLPGGTSSFTRAFWSVDGGGSFRSIIRQEDPVPGLPGREFRNWLPTSLFARGASTYRLRSQFVPSIPGGEGIWAGSPEKGWTLVADESTDPLLREFGLVQFDREGDGALRSRTTEGLKSVWTISGGRLELIARQGSPVFDRDDGSIWSGELDFRLNDEGVIALQSRSTTWLLDRDGNVNALSNGSSERRYANDMALGNGGHVVVKTFLRGGSSSDTALVALDGTESPPPIAVRNAPVPGIPADETYSRFNRLAIDSRGHVVFLASLRAGIERDPTPGTNEAVLFVPVGREPTPVLAEGDVVEVAPGEVRIVRSIEVDRGPDQRGWSNDSGEIVVLATFDDESEAILLLRVPVLADEDGDGVPDLEDNCPGASNPGQSDLDGDGTGDACNGADDADDDDIADLLDNCPGDPNPDQSDLDGDGEGDACNDARDGDGDDYRDDLDNCPATPNDQFDLDADGLGDACDPFPLEADNVEAQLREDLEDALDELAVCVNRPVFEDADGDAEEDSRDRCPDTPRGAEVDDAGCSQAQFCELQGGKRRRPLTCFRLDWKNDEPGSLLPRDCAIGLAEGKGRWRRLRCRAVGGA